MLPCHEGRPGNRYAMPEARAVCLAFDMRWKGQATDLSRHVLDAGQ